MPIRMCNAVNMMPLVVAALFALNMWPAASCGQNFFQKLQSMNFENLFQQRNDFRRAYDEINNLLEKSVDSDDIEKNMEVISRWKQHYTNEIRDDDDHHHSDQMLAALFQLEALSDEDPDPCTLSSHETLVANDLATRQFLHKLKPKEVPKRRVDKIVYHYALKEARECEFYYMSEFESAGLELGQKSYDRVTKFMGDLINMRINKNPSFKMHLGKSSTSNMLEESPIETSRFAETMRFRRNDFKESSLLYKWLKEFADQAKDKLKMFLNRIRITDRQKPQLDEPQVKKLFKTYLVAPCQEYVEKLHAAFSNNLSLIKGNENKDDLTMEFYKHSALWHGCNRFLEEESISFGNLKRWIMKEAPVVWMVEIN